jgi:hypothetical protein
VNKKESALVEISFLVNSAIYFYDSVFIVVETNGYRLIINHRNSIIYDCRYSTIKGARIAFAKMTKRNKVMKIKPDWSFFYPPEAKWLEHKLNGSPVDSGIREFLV